jgi:hypothetical protein
MCQYYVPFLYGNRYAVSGKSVVIGFIFLQLVQGSYIIFLCAKEDLIKLNVEQTGAVTESKDCIQGYNTF